MKPSRCSVLNFQPHHQLWWGLELTVFWATLFVQLKILPAGPIPLSEIFMITLLSRYNFIFISPSVVPGKSIFICIGNNFVGPTNHYGIVVSISSIYTWSDSTITLILSVLSPYDWYKKLCKLFYIFSEITHSILRPDRISHVQEPLTLHGFVHPSLL